MATTRVSDLIAIASRLSGISERDILGTSRLKHIVRVRQAVAAVAVSQGVHSTPQIGRFIGGRDHTTVLHSVKKVAEITKRNPEYAHFVERIKTEALAAEPYLAGWGEQFEFALPAKPKPVVKRQMKPIVPRDPKDDDGEYSFHRSIAVGSANLLAALRAAA